MAKVSGPSLGENETLSVRKIENGYILRKECYGKSGYKVEEKYSPTKPEIVAKAMPAPKAKPAVNALTRAVKTLERKGPKK